MKANCVLENIMTILQQIYVEVVKNVIFNVICVYFRQVFIKNLHKMCLVWWAIDCTYYYWFLVFGNNNSKNMFSMSLEKYDLTL